MIILIILLLTVGSAFATDPVTPNLGLSLYPPNAPWHREAEGRFKDAVNQNFRLLDNAVAQPVSAIATPITTYPGIDCSGDTDSSPGLNAVFEGVEANTIISFPKDCILRLESTVTILGTINLTLRSEGYYGTRAIFKWYGPNNGTMFAVTANNQPRFDGFFFAADADHIIDTFLDFGGDGSTPGGTVPTAAQVKNSSFSPGAQQNAAFKAVKIGTGTQVNHELYDFDHVQFFCNGFNTTRRSFVGAITNASTTVTCADCKFVAGDVGKRIRLSYINGFLDTTIATRVSATEITVAAPAASTQTNVTVHTGTNYGTAVYIASNPNSKHHVFNRTHFIECEYGIYAETGSFVIRDGNGNWNNTDIYIGNVTEPVLIDQWTSEASQRMVEATGGAGTVRITGARLSNDLQFANGFWLLSGSVHSESNMIETVPQTNQVIWGDKLNGNLRFVSIGDRSVSNITTTQLGVPYMQRPPTMVRPSATIRDPDYSASNLSPALTVRDGMFMIDATPPTSTELWTETVPFFHTRGTWNVGGSAVTAWFMNITDTASGAASKFLDFQVGGASKFSINKSGAISVDNTAGHTGTISVRKGDDSAACNIVVKGGIITSTTC